jgi:hypothetical protein
VSGRDDLDDLRRHAEDVAHTTGLTIEVSEADYRIGGRPQHGFYNVQIPGETTGPLSFDRAWGELNGIEAGVLAVRATSSYTWPPPVTAGTARTRKVGRLRRWVGGAR